MGHGCAIMMPGRSMKPRLMKGRRPFPVFGMVVLAIAALGSPLSCRRGERPPDRGRPGENVNVVLVSIDTLRADRLNSYGYERRKTSPNLDALAREGILFENFITAAPWTTPAHLSMLTSLHPSAHGVIEPFSPMYRKLLRGGNFLSLAERTVTLAETLKAEGFRTAAFTAGGPLDPKLGFGQGFEEYTTSMYKLQEQNMGEMFAWLQGNRAGRFFLFWHHFEVHAPYLNADFVGDVLPPDVAKWVQAEMRALARVSSGRFRAGDAGHQRSRQEALLRQQGLFTRDVCDALYTSGVLSADRWLGRLLEVLRDAGLYEKTMIIVTSDHGEQMGERRRGQFYNIHGHRVFEEMIRIPLVIRLPNQAGAGTRVRQVTRTIDIMPTVLDFLGIDPANDEMQGTSLVPYWATPAEAPEQIAYTEALATGHEKKSLRTSRYKYILNVPRDLVREFGRAHLPDRALRPQLFDLETDPGERVNLLWREPDPGVRAMAAEFDRKLRDHVARNQGRPETTQLDDDTLEQLRALGYLGSK
jgi:arylsulfatase A-like enzyme